MKRLVFLLLGLGILLWGCAPSLERASFSQMLSDLSETSESDPKTASPTAFEEIRGVWISYLELNRLFSDTPDEDTFRTRVEEMVENCKEKKINTILLQFRAFGDSLSPSTLFPQRYALSYDPAEIFVLAAKEAGLRIEAWINPMRCLTVEEMNALSCECALLELYQSKEEAFFTFDDRLYLDPGCEESVELIVLGIGEIVEKYPVDGIHIDDYFYPSALPFSADSRSYLAYTESDGSLSQGEWRKENLNRLVERISLLLKEENPSLSFGVSPRGVLNASVNELFADVAFWAEAGYLTYLAPQIYFGFEHQTAPFDTTLNDWLALSERTGVPIYVGLAVYKADAPDSYAGTGENEWIENDDLLSRQLTYLRKAGAEGCFLFRYDSLFSPDNSERQQTAVDRLFSLF